MEYPIYAKSGLTGRKAVYIKNPDNNTDAYQVDIQGKEVTVRRYNDQGPVVGIVKFANWPAALEIVFEGNERVEMRKDGFKTTTQVVDIPAAPEISPVKWRAGHGFGESWRAADAKGADLASFKKNHVPGARVGTLKLNQAAGLSQDVLDQLIVTYMAVDEKHRRQKKTGRGSALCGACIVDDAGM